MGCCGSGGSSKYVERWSGSWRSYGCLSVDVVLGFGVVVLR